MQPLNENLSAYQARNRLACGFGWYMKIKNMFALCKDGRVKRVDGSSLTTWSVDFLVPEGWSIV